MSETVSAQALRESEELHRVTLLSMMDAVFITDDDGVFTFICPNVDVIFGYGPEEVQAIGRIAGLLGRALTTREQLAAQGEVRNIELEIEAKGGERRQLLVHIKQVSIKGGTILYVCRDITERKQSELALRRNEERLKLALEAANMGTWDWHVPTGEMTWSLETHRLLGDPGATRAPSFDSFLERVHPLDRGRVAQAMSDAMDGAASYETDFRVVGYDAIERWVIGKGKALRNGHPLRMLGVFVDLTERHLVEQELRDVGGRLINAHEQERARLSRDLHDDVGQRVALLSAELAMLRHQLGEAAPHVREHVARLSSQTEEIGLALHRLSHELHPARLEQLGLEASIRSFCHDLAAAQRITVNLEIDEVPPMFEADAALCLYRIVQEALHNVVKHSGAARVTVALSGGSDDVVLSIVDDGIGFDPLAVRRKDTLGLVSMRERARLAKADLTVSSQPGKGTQVHVRLPVESSRTSRGGGPQLN